MSFFNPLAPSSDDDATPSKTLANPASSPVDVSKALTGDAASRREALIQAIYAQESGSGRANTEQAGNRGARGPMQVIRPTFDLVKAKGLVPADYEWANPEHSRQAGVALVNYLADKYADDPRKVTAAYYSGEKAVNKDGTINDFRDPVNRGAPSTLGYVDQVVARMAGGKKTEAPPTWNEVESSSGYQRLSGEDQEKWKTKYFASFIAPKFNDSQVYDARIAFDNETNRGVLGVAKDRALELGSATGGVVQLLGTILGLSVGDYGDARPKDREADSKAWADREVAGGMPQETADFLASVRFAVGTASNTFRESGKNLSGYFDDQASPTMVGQKAAREEDVKAADGQLAKAWAWGKSTILSPELIASEITQQIPQFAVMGGAGRLVGAALKSGAAATASTVATGAVLQGADIAGDTYDQALKALLTKNGEITANDFEAEFIRRGGSVAQARALALSLSTKAALSAGGLSVVTNSLPGMRYADRLLAGSVGKKAAGEIASSSILKEGAKTAGKAALGEGVGEITEEVGGKLANNALVGQVDPSRNLTDDLGVTAVQSGLIGGAMGTVGGAREGAIHAMRQKAAELRGETPSSNDQTAEQPVPPGDPAGTALVDPVHPANWELVNDPTAPAGPALPNGTPRLPAPANPALGGPTATEPAPGVPDLTGEAVEPAIPVEHPDSPPLREPATPQGIMAQGAVETFKKAFKGAGKLGIRVFDSPDAMGPGFAQSGSEGWYNRHTGEIGLVASEFTGKDGGFDGDRFFEVLHHEVIGHHGVESLVRGKSFDALVEDVHRLMKAKVNIDDKSVGKDANSNVTKDDANYLTVEAVERAYTDNGVKPTRTLVAMELLARMAEKGVKPGFVDRISNLIREKLRPVRQALGLADAPITAAQLRGIVNAARLHVQRGDNTLLPAGEADALVAKATPVSQSRRTLDEVKFDEEDLAKADAAASRMANPDFYDKDKKPAKPDENQSLSKDDKAALREELAAEQAPPTIPSKAPAGPEPTDAEIAAHGIMAERAYPDLKYKSEQDPDSKHTIRHRADHGGAAYRITESSVPNGKGGRETFFRAVPGVPDSGNGSALYLQGAKSKQAAELYNKTHAAARNLTKRGFDLLSAAEKPAQARVLKLWRQIAANPGAFRFGMTDSKRKPVGSVERIKALIDELGIKREFDTTITVEGRDVRDGRDGVKYAVEMTHKSKTVKSPSAGTVPVRGTGEIEYINGGAGKLPVIVLHTTEMDAGSSVGTPFYQLGAALAEELGVTVKADPNGLTGINSYRRTEQMMSSALRAGTAGRVQPGTAQRIYGWNEKAKSANDKNANLVRIALASARNNAEAFPGIKDIRYDVASGKFTYIDGSSADAAVNAAVASPDARSFGMSQTSMARAALTFEALAGQAQTISSVAVNKPVAYSRSVGEREAPTVSLFRRVMDSAADILRPGQPAEAVSVATPERYTRSMAERLNELEGNRDRTDAEDAERQRLIRIENENTRPDGTTNLQEDAPPQEGWENDYATRPSWWDAPASSATTPTRDTAFEDGMVARARAAAARIGGAARAGGDTDIYTSVPRAARRRIVELWKGVFGNPAAFKYGKVKPESKTMQEIVHDMGLDRKYGVTVREHSDGGFTLNYHNLSDGTPTIQMGDASWDTMGYVTDSQGRSNYRQLATPHFTLHTMGFERGGLGASFYAAMQEYASRNGKKIEPDGSLTEINSTRRTENAFSGVARTGRTDMNPKEGHSYSGSQGIRGFNRAANTEEQFDRNMVRIALRSVENTRAAVPELDELRYSPAADRFTMADGRNAEEFVKRKLDRNMNSEAYKKGLGRTTLARAVMTNMAANGLKVDTSRIAVPLMSSKKVGPRVTVSTGRIRKSIDELVQTSIKAKDWRDWYTRHDTVLSDLLGSDADLFQRILSITSQASSVPSNVSLALKAFRQYYANEPFIGFMPQVATNLERLRAGKDVRGPKIEAYEKANAGDAAGIAVDRHIARLLFNVEKPNGRQITAAHERIVEVARRLQWEPREVQAALWAYQQLKGNEVKRARDYEGELAKRSDQLESSRLLAEQARERAGGFRRFGDLARGRYAQAQDAGAAGKLDARSGGQAVQSRKVGERHDGSLAFEVAPDPANAALMERWTKLPTAERARITALVKDEVLDDIVRAVGVDVKNTTAAVGGFASQINPNLITEYEQGKLSIEQARALAAAIGMALDQDSVALVDSRAADELGVVNVALDVDAADHVADIMSAIQKVLPGVDGFTASGKNIDILNFTDMDTASMAGKIEEAMSSLPHELHAKVQHGTTHSELVEKASYESHIAGVQSESGGGVRSKIEGARDRARQIVTREVGGTTYSKRVGPRVAPGHGAVGDGDAGSADQGTIRGAVHFGKVGNLTQLTGIHSGTGIKGDEQARLSEPGVDPRIKRRVYFYLPEEGGLPQPESGLGGHVYTADLKGLYNPASDQIIKGNGNAFESAVLDAGFNGYVAPDMGMAVVLNGNVPVTYQGTVAGKKIIPRTATAPPPAIKTRTEGAELVRRMDKPISLTAKEAAKAAAPSFRIEYGEARVNAGEAAGANAALDRAGSGFQFSRATGAAINPSGTDYSSGPLDALFKHTVGKTFGQYISQPIWDRVTRFAGKVIPEKVKAGLVSDHGLDEPYLDTKFDRDVAVNKLHRKAQGVLAGIAGMSAEQSKVAYHWMQEKPNSADEAALMARLSPEDQAVVLDMKAMIDQLGRDAVAAGLLSQETYDANKMAYLHRSYVKHELNTPAQQQRMKESAALRADNMKMRGIKDTTTWDNLVQNTDDEVKLHDKMIRLESRSPATAKEIAAGRSGDLLRAVRYVPVGKPIPAKYASWKNDGEWEVMGLNKNKTATMRRQLTKAERLALGEIEEVRFAFAKTVLQAVRDIENARFLRWVKTTYGKDPKTVDPGHMKATSENFWTLMSYAKDDMVTVPAGKIGKTGINRYGDLAGTAIPGSVWNDLRNSMSMPESDIAKVVHEMTKVWKVSKTALSPAVHMNNVMSNFILADMADVGAHDVVKAALLIAKAKSGDAAAKATLDAYKDSGADSGSFAANEINVEHIQPLLDALAQQGGPMPQLRMAQIVNLALHGEVKAAAKALGQTKAAKTSAVPFKAMMKAYAAEDGLFRMAKYLKELDHGKSERDAAKAARDAFLNYNINAPWIQTMRRSGLPFVAFSYRAFPLIAQTIAAKPWKAAKYLAVFSALNALAYAALGAGGDEDKERRLLPDEMKGKMLGMFPRMMRMPWNDANGNPVFLDVRRWVPGGDVFDLNQSKAQIPIPSWLTVGGPFAMAVELFANRSLFTGKEITNQNDTIFQAAMKVADWQYKFWTPNIPLPGLGTIVPGTEQGQLQSFSWQGILNAATGKTDAFGREMSTGQALLNSVGVKLKAYPEDVAKQRIGYELQSAKSGVDQTINSAARQRHQNGISDAEFQRIKEREVEKLQRAARRAQEALN